MSANHKIVWHEGQLLTPHHFQQWDQYHESLLQERSQETQPLGWGIKKIEIDKDGLRNGQLTLLTFEGRWPDGLSVQIPDRDLPPPTIDVGEIFTEKMNTMEVFLTIPRDHVGLANCRLDKSPGLRPHRFSGAPLSVPDYNSGENAREVLVAQKNLRLVFKGEDRQDVECLKIAELERTLGGAIAMRESFIPPLIWIQGSPFLVRQLRSWIEVLISMAAELADQQRGIREHGGMDLTRFAMLQSIYSHVPLLMHYAQLGHVHPESLYRVLIRLAGELALVGEQAYPRHLPPYEHGDLSKTFQELDLHVRKVVEYLKPMGYIPIPLQHQAQFEWMGRIPEELSANTARFFLVVTGGESEEQVRKTLPVHIKIAGEEDIKLLVKRHLQGIPVHYEPRPPASIPLKLGHQYFMLEREGPLWAQVFQKKSLVIHLPEEVRGLEMELLATKK